MGARRSVTSRRGRRVRPARAFADDEKALVTRHSAFLTLALSDVAKSSSTNKAARLAEKGGGGTVRFQGGKVFPIAVLLTLVIGITTIVYGRSTIAPTKLSTDKDWRVASGINICGEWFNFDPSSQDTDANGRFTGEAFTKTGIHSLDQGVVRWWPVTDEATSSTPSVGALLAAYGVELTDTTLTFPEGISFGPESTYVEDETKCGDKVGYLSVKVWDDASNVDKDKVYTTRMAEAPTGKDGMAWALYFVPVGDDRPQPPSVGHLNSAATPASTETTVADTETTVAETETTVAETGATSTTEAPSDGD